MAASRIKEVLIKIGDDDPNDAYILSLYLLGALQLEELAYLKDKIDLKVEKRSSLPELDQLIAMCATGLLCLDQNFNIKNRGGEYSKIGDSTFAGGHWLVNRLVKDKNFNQNVMITSAHAPEFVSYFAAYLNNKRDSAEAEALRLQERNAMDKFLLSGRFRGIWPKPLNGDEAPKIVSAAYEDVLFYANPDNSKIEVYSYSDIEDYKKRITDIRAAMRLT